MKKKKTSRIIAVCMAAVLLIGSVGCSSAEEGSQASVPGGSEQASSLSTDGAQNEKPTDQNDQIVIAGYRDPGRGTKDPYYTNVNLYVWEPLIGETDQGEPEPRLATSWDRNEDATVWTFHLREGVQFSDGVPFNADAVLKNFERYRNMGVVSSTFFAFDVDAVYPGLQSVEKEDDYTVRLTFENPIPTLPYTMINFGCGMFSPECYDPQTGEFKEYCVGTGPFVISEHVPDEYITLERNEKYYGDPAKAASIKIRIIPDHETRIAALRSGEIMGVYDNNAILPQSAKELGEAGGFVVSSALSANIQYLNVNNQNFPFNDVRMRRAMSMIIDRDTLLNDIYCGYGKTTVNVLSPMSVFYQDIQPEYNPEAAKALAAEVLQGQTPTVRLLTASTYKTDAELISYWLGELGLNVQIQVLDSAAVSAALKERDFDLSMGFKGMNNAEPETMLRGFLHTDGFMNNGFAMSGYHNEEVDALLDQLKDTYDEEERAALFNQLQKIGAEELPVIPLIAVTTLVVHSDQVTGYDAKFTGITLPEVAWVS